jgi:serine protease
MRVFRARLLWVTVFVAAGLVLGLRGQTARESRFFVAHVGLPAVDVGLRTDEMHGPGQIHTLRRAAIQASLQQQQAPVSGARYTPGRVLVKFLEGLPSAARLSAMADVSRSAVMAARPSYADFDVVRIDPNEDAEVVARAFSDRPDVEYAQAAYRIHTMFVPNDPLYGSMQWNLPMLNLERAWDIQPQAGSTVTVAVLDSGMAFRNDTFAVNMRGFRDEFGRIYPALGPMTIPYSAAPQLVSASGASRVVAPRDFIWDDDEPFDFDGHGTHVSGTIGQLTNDSVGTAGVAFNVKLMPVKVIDGFWDFLFGSPNEGTDETVARGIRYAADNGAKIINMSIGRTGPPNTAPAVESAIRHAVGRGAFIAIAAGNDFEDGNPLEVIAEIASRVPGAVSVAAVDRNRGHAFYSATASWIELAAPGGSSRGFGVAGAIFQQTFVSEFTDTFLQPPSQFRAPRFDVFRYAPFQGTSMAAPHVAGVAAMLMQQGITDPVAIEEALERTAVDLGAPGRDDTFGFGLVDARAALRGVGMAK